MTKEILRVLLTRMTIKMTKWEVPPPTHTPRFSRALPFLLLLPPPMPPGVVRHSRSQTYISSLVRELILLHSITGVLLVNYHPLVKIGIWAPALNGLGKISVVSI